MRVESQPHIAGRQAVACVLVGMVLGLCAGCYDREALVTQAQSKAISTRLAEVDLGQFLTTLPREDMNRSFIDLELHIFGAVPRYRVSAVKRQLRAEEYRLRHETLAAVRSATPKELAEPDLKKLRARIERAVNGILADAPVEAIGFYHVNLRRR